MAKTLTFTSYSTEAFSLSADKLIYDAETQLKGLDVDFDSMVGIGMSGLLVLPLLARHFKVPFLALRKPGESSHMPKAVAHGEIGQKWILVDDFIETGATVLIARQIVSNAAKTHGFVTTYMGTYCYSRLFGGEKDGLFITPEEKRKAVVRCVTEDETYYIPYGEYYSMRSHFLCNYDAYSGSVRKTITSTIIYAKKRFPHMSHFDIGIAARDIAKKFAD